MSVRIELRRDLGRTRAWRGADPWIRRRQIARVQGPPDPLALARVVDHRGDTLGWGLYSPDSNIVVRLLAWGEAPPEDDWLTVRIASALTARERLGLGARGTDGYRAINSEGDRLPGLTVDRYRDVHVVALTTAPMVARREQIERALAASGAARRLVLVSARTAEREGVEAGVWGEALSTLRYREHGIELSCPAPPAQKTGGYLDQRDNRAIVARLAAGHGGPLLDVGSHVGGFSLHAARRGVDCVAVDQSELALEHVRRNADALPDAAARVRTVLADMFDRLDDPALAGPFGTIVLDPPKIAAARRDRTRAMDALARTVGQLLPRVDAHGYFVLCSCSHHVGREDLDAVVGRSLSQPQARAGAWVRVLALGPGPDHPVWPGHAEGEYLRVNVYQRRA